MSSTCGISSDRELRDLEHKIIEVFADAQEGIKANSFWTCFYNKHGFYPDQKKFGCHKRSELLDLFPDLLVTVENSKRERILTLKEKVLADENNSGSEAIRCSGQKQQIEKAKRAKELQKTERTRSDECSAAVYGPEMAVNSDNKTMSHKQPGNEFYRFYKRQQNADPLQKGNIPCDLQQTQAANASSVPSLMGVAAAPLMPSFSFTNTKLLLQQNQPYPHQLQGFSFIQPHEGPLPVHAGSISMPLNTSQNNSMVAGHDFPAVGKSSSGATTSGKSFEISSRAQRPVEKYSTGTTMGVRRTNITRDQMNTVADDCIERLSESKEYVSLERIEKLFLQHYSVNSLAQLNLRHLEELACVNEHIRRECRVNLYIQMFIKTRAICTVHELSQCLKEFAPNRQEFETLRLGPVNKMPLVLQSFLIPANKEICEIETADVLEYLRCYLTENDLWTDHKASIEDFLKYMMEKRGLSTPYELGVRLKSLPLGIQVLKKGQRDCGNAIRDAVARLKTVVENDIGTAFHYFTSGMFHKEPGICQLRQEYLSMPFVDVISSFFAKLTKLYRVVTEQEASWELSTKVPGTAKARRREINKTQATLNDLKSLLSRDILLQKLMHIAICCSEEQVHQQLQELFVKKDNASSDKSRNEPGPENIPKKDELIVAVNKYMERCIAHGPLTLDKLSKIEERIIEDFRLKHFSSLNQGHFLHFLLNSEPVHKLLDESGGTLLGSSHAVGTESCYHANVEDLLDFITQCAYKDPLQHKFIEMAMCHHYSVKDVKFLGHGHFANLMKMVERQQRPNRSCGVLYAGTLVAKQFPTALAPDRSTGPLGHMTKEKALACLQSCPLLEDLALWSQWDLVFKPELRELKDFLQKYGGAQITTVTEGASKKTLCTNILALEVRPGSLLKLTGDTSPEMFAEAAAARDVSRTCGHLVSLIAVNRGTENTPLALLDNSFRAALLHIHASQPNEIGTYGLKKERDVSVDIARFVLDCIVRVPLVIGHHVVNQVFLQGLNFVIGQTKSKELLLHCAQTAEHRSHLQALGILLGIKEWAESFCERLIPPPDCIKELDSSLTDIVTEEESSEADEGSMSESEFSLSDDDENDNEDGNKTDNDKEVNLKGNGIQQKKKIASQKLIVADAEKDQTEPLTALDESDNEIFKECVDEPAAEQDVKDIFSDFEEPDFEDKAVVEATSAVTESEKEQKCQNLIDQIRQEEFGFNVELNEDGTRLLTKQQERLGRSLERLSKDLYSKDTHFVLELIQNADDNEYPEDILSSQLDLVPSVQFIVNRDSIIVYNNEVGFKEKNIRAICDVGRTTKGKHKFGYIGQKGIGFKSVFRITDTPEIHSNGYHIRFDANSKPLGYILPSWLNKDQHFVELSELWTTCIALPLKWEMKEQLHSLSLAARFRDIHPSLLLFLHRLRSIEIINEVEGYTSKMRRNDIGEGVTEIEHQNGIDRWLVVRKRLDASQISLQAKSGIEVESTEIALAFPMISKEMTAAKVLPERQPVFAFLPLRSYGFRFVVQGDFDVPSSREEVDRDSMWNQWLRNEIHHVFINALEVFKSHSEFDPVEAVSYFLQFVPNTDEILDFFRPVAANILNQLKAKPCLPSQGLQWKLPSQLLICSDPLVHEIVSDSLLRQHLGLDYLNREVEACTNPPLLESLGVQTLTTHHLIEVGKSIVSSLNSSESEDISRSIIMISKWLSCISRSMDEFSNNNDILTSLRALPMIPLTNGKVVSLESQTVFFPLSTLEKEAARINLLRRLESDMQTVHPLLLGPPDDMSSLKIMLLLQQLDVKKLTPYEVIQHHILPALKSPDAEDKPRDLLMVYLLYIKEHFNSQHSMLDMNEIKEAAILLTNHGPKRPHLVSVHFTEAYDNRFSLKQLLPGYPWILVDSCYLHGSQFVSQFLEWKEFLKSLGVLDFLAVKQRKVVLKPLELAESPWSLCKESLPDLDEYHILDSECEEFESLVKHNAEPRSLMDQMKCLFEQLDATWDASYKRHAVTQITNSQGVPLKEVATSFGNLLVSLQWIPSRFDKTRELALAKGCDLFVSTPETENLMAYHVSYIIPKVLIKSSFAQHLGIRHTIGVEFVASQLMKWSARCENELRKPTLFDSSINHLRCVYEYLADNLPRKRIQELFDHPVIFYPGMSSKEKGRFLMKHEVRWSDPSGLFEEYREDLLPEEGSSNAFRVTIDFLYHEQEILFLDIARVQMKPDVGDYIELLIQISSMMPLHRVLTDVLTIYSLVGRELMETGERSSGLMKENLIALMKQSKAIAGKNGCWIGLDNKTMIADDKQLEKLFSSSEVDFVECGEKLGIGRARVTKELKDINLDYVIKFMTSLGVEKLSSCVDIKSQTEMYQPCPSLQQYVHEVVPFIQRMVYFYPTIYDYLVSKKDIKSKLANMQFAQVAKLELIHSIINLPHVPPVIFPQKCRLLNDQEMYVHRDSVNAHNDINRELARYFSCIGIPCPDEVAQCSDACFTQLKSFLGEILPHIQTKSSAIDELLDEHNLLAFPVSEEPLWEVKEPVVVVKYPQHSDVGHNVKEPLTENALESADGEEIIDDGSSSTGLKSWPPQAPSARIHSGTKTGGQPNPLMWPPPAPAPYMDHANLPSNIRPSNLEREPVVEVSVGEVPHRVNEDSLQKQPESMKEATAENFKTRSSGSTGKAHVASSIESVPRQIPSDEKLIQKPGQEGDVHDNEPKVESSGAMPDSAPAEALRLLQYDATALANVDSRLLRSNANVNEPMVIEFSLPSAEANALARPGHKRARVSSGPSSDECVIPRTKQLITSHFYGPPIWLAQTDENVFVDLELADDLLIPQNINLSEDSDTMAIGVWGESLVKNFLEKYKLQDDSNIVEIIHVNQDFETGKPYDFLVRHQSGDSVSEVYIEVKTTISSSKACFQISFHQLMFAYENGPNYHLYRVFSAGNPSEVRLAKIENLLEKMMQEKVKLMMII